MTITADSPYRGVNRISRERFRQLAQERFAPAVLAERDTGEYWDAIIEHGCDATFILAIFKHESTYGRYGVAMTTRSWGNTRQPSFGATPIGEVPGRTGTFPVFRNWLDGCISTAARLTDPNWYYAREDRSIGEVFTKTPNVWAPAGDLNDPAGYLRDVLDTMNQAADLEETPSPMPDRPFHVAISYGHHNTDGGNAVEKQQTPQIGQNVRDACRALGMEVRVVQDEIGINPNIGLQQVAQKVVDWDRAGWPVDLYLEVHTEGAGQNARGVFAIYPNMGGELDNDAKRVGQDAAKRIAQAAGIGLRGDGTMAESATGVGAQGSRLGIFLRTAAINDHATRMIIEYGSHDNPDDYAAIMAHLPEIGMATAQAFADEARRLGFSVGDAAPIQGEEPQAVMRESNGHVIQGGFLAFIEKLESLVGPDQALMLIGLPLSDEYQREDGQTVQDFERARLEWSPGQRGEWYDTLLGRVNAELLALKASQP